VIPFSTDGVANGYKPVETARLAESGTMRDVSFEDVPGRRLRVRGRPGVPA
jgi:hypothetical protein